MINIKDDLFNYFFIGIVLSTGCRARNECYTFGFIKNTFKLFDMDQLEL